MIEAETLLSDPDHNSIEVLLEVVHIGLAVNRFEQEYIISVQDEFCVLGQQVYIIDRIHEDVKHHAVGRV